MYENYGESHNLKRFLLVKQILTAFLFLGINFGYASEIYPQSSVTVSVKDKTLRDAIAAIEKNSEYIFIYSDNTLDLTKKVSIDADGTDIRDVLDDLFSATNIRYIINGRQIALSKKSPDTQNPDPQQVKGIRVVGTVADGKGDVLAGVAITVNGTNITSTSDANGEFTITVPGETSVLRFASDGYDTQEITLGNRRILSVTLIESAEKLESMTIVAFGTQSKESVIGAITTIDPAELKIPTSNLTTAFAGNIAGMIAYQRSGEPGADNADFFVRGITTFGANTTPLILIDNIELTSDDLARLQPDDIASFSIMKDATATALYGARGANGVILVTTKRGAQGKAKISLRLENSFSSPTQNVEFADPVTYMKLGNEAVLTRDPLAMLPYSQDKINNTLKPGSSPYIYPANDWHSMLMKNFATSQRVNLSVSGGGNVARYYVSAAFTKDTGILKVDKRNSFNSNIDSKNYTLRANIDMDITRTTVLSVRLTGNFDDYTGPLEGGEKIYKLIVRSNPVLFPAYFPVNEQFKYANHILFGNYDEGGYINPYAEMVKGYKDRARSQMLAIVEVNQDLGFITKGLKLMSMLNISRLSEFSVSRSYNPFYYRILDYDSFTGEYQLDRINENGTEYLGYSESPKTAEATMYTETRLNYNNVFGKHSLGALLVFTTRQWLAANQGSLQLSLPSRNAGLAGRATYSYGSRYFAEFNFGYNGSERFAANHRWGFFPSAGVAWVISNENFWKKLKPVVNNLKLRYSYGLVGNDQIGEKADRFFYISQVDMNDENSASYFGENWDKGGNGIRVNRYANEDITWETSTKQNYAIELGLFDKFSLIAEYFTEYRRNILMTRSAIPSTMGLQAAVRANIGEASAHGCDIQADYQHVFNKDLWVSARANFTWSTSRYEVYEEPDYAEYWRSRVGYPIKQNWGYIAERLFMDDAEANNSPEQAFGSMYGGGDIKYTDVNGDGKITAADMVPIGNPTTPEIVYGFGASIGYKGFDFSVFFQGLGNESFWINPYATAPFVRYVYNKETFPGGTILQNQLLKAYADSHWSESNQDLYALWPRLSASTNSNNTQSSTWFMRDGSFIRLKQAELGYTIPGKWRDKLHIRTLRIYVSGTNLWLFSKFKLWDVEMAGNGLGYPLQKTLNVGLNITFN